MKVLMAILAFTLAGCVHSDPWTRQDTTLQLIVTGLYAVDAIQTADIQNHRGIKEGGPLASHVLGKQPRTSDAWMYFATMGVSNYLITRALPRRWRPFWQGGTIAIETAQIISNCALGVPRLCHEGPR